MYQAGSLSKMLRVSIYDLFCFACDRKNWCIILILSIFIHENTQEIAAFANAIEQKMTIWFFPFIMSTRIVRLVIILGFIILMAEVPFYSAKTPQVVIRSGKINFYLGKVIFIFIASLFYFLIVAIIPIIVNLGTLKLGCDWGKVFGTISYGKIDNTMLYSIKFSSKIINRYMPLQATAMSYSLSVLMGVVIGGLFCLMNMLTNSKILGGFICFFWALLDFLLQTMDYLRNSVLIFFSPFTWSDIKYLDYRGNTPYPTFKSAIFMYTCIIIFLVVCLLLFQKKKEIKVVC